MPKRTKNDRALRFYHELLGLERLHYGLWSEEDPRTIAGLKQAQERYEEKLIESIPDGTRTILDVGCGTGVMTARLLELGYDVEGLSPDVNQVEPFKQATGNATFHHCCFEDFEPTRQYDVLMFSESAQYIPLPDLFIVADKALADNGTMIVCDYFVRDNATGPMAKSGHRIGPFDSLAKEAGFSAAHEEDITDEVAPTLELARQAIDKYVFPAVDLVTEKMRARRKRTVRLFRWLFRKKIRSLKEEMALLDAEEFRKMKCYRLLILRRKS